MSTFQTLRKPPNGMWKGYYKDDRKGIGTQYGNNEFQMGITFSDDGFLIGSGLDKEFNRFNRNGFDIIGQWKPSNSTLTFTKSYRNQHGVYYSGVISYDCNQVNITGHWKLTWHGNFENDFYLVHIGQSDTEMFDWLTENRLIEEKIHCIKSSFVKNINEFRQESNQGAIESFSDFKITSKLEEKSVDCNKIILAMQSPYFMKKFKEDPSTGQEMVDFSHDCIQTCIDMLYTGETNLTDKNVENVLELSDKLQLNVIKEQAIDFIVDGVGEINCIKILILGNRFNSESMIAESIRFITKNFDGIEAKCNTDLYQLPLHLFEKVLESDDLILRSKETGIIYTGVMREFAIISFLERYITLHPEINDKEASISCVRLPESLLNSLSTISATGLISELEDNGFISYHSDVADKKDAMESRCEKEKSYVTLLSSRDAIYSQLTNDFDNGKFAKLAGRIINVIDRTSEKCLKMLETKIPNPRENISNNLLKSKPSTFQRKLSKTTCFSTFPIGNEADYGENEQKRVSMFGIIRKIRIHSSQLRGRNAEQWQANSHQIILKGLEFDCHENSQSCSIGLDDGEGTFIDEFELEEGEHICMVKGRSAEFLIQLCFVTNKGRMLKMGGNICTRMGEEFSTVTYVRRNTPQDTLIPLQHMYLKGISANLVRTREGFSAATQVQFCMGIITDDSVIVRPPNHDLAILALRARDY